jgi:hypothetical protein
LIGLAVTAFGILVHPTACICISSPQGFVTHVLRVMHDGIVEGCMSGRRTESDGGGMTSAVLRSGHIARY